MSMSNLRRTTLGLVILLLVVAAGSAEAAVPQNGSIGIRTIDSAGNLVPFQTVRVHLLNGNWPQPDFVADTNVAAMTWASVLPGLYEVTALDHEGAPLPGGFQYNVSSGSEAFFEIFVPALCTGDVNNSGQTDFGDILTLLANWGPCAGACPWDLSGNAQVDFADVLIVIGAWGSCS